MCVCVCVCVCVYIYIELTPHAGHFASITEISRWLVYGEIKAVYCNNHIKLNQTVSEAHQPPATQYQQQADSA